MDLREKKTKQSITDAFFKLRKDRPLERIRVKELAELAQISKATFYLHYRDIYDLSERLQDEVIQSILASIAHPEYCLTNTAGFTHELFQAFFDQQEKVDILFSGNQAGVLPVRIEKELRAFIIKMDPRIRYGDDVLLTYRIQGGYYAYQKHHKEYGIEEIVRLVGNVSMSIMGE